LNLLYHRGVFKFLIDKRRWEWDLKKVEGVEVSDNVIDLLVQSLESLPPKTLIILKLAACIGNYFDLKTLSLVSEQSAIDVGENLWAAVEGEIIYPLDNNYRLINLKKKGIEFPSVEVIFYFQHDRIQQAVYSLIPDDEKALIHQRIGKFLLQSSYKESKNLCPEIIQYVVRTMKNIVINNAGIEGDFQNCPYIQEHQIKSVLCMPVIYQNTLKGVVYLENNLSDNVFNNDRIKILKILSFQASISIDNARLYKNLEDKVRERTIQLKSANEKLKELSLLDPLTSLHNRRYIYEFVSELSVNFIKNKIRLLNNDDKRDLSVKNKVLGVFLIDIDHFKEVNDTYGHLAGDNVLVSISKEFKKMIRVDDFIVRWGGEEFLIILNNTNPEYLEIFLKKVINTIKKTALNLFDNKTIYRTCSIGCTKIPIYKNAPGFLTLEQTINLCDYALYLAKENGRDCAAYIKLKEQDNINEDIKQYLINLSKNIKINYDFIDIEFIK